MSDPTARSLALLSLFQSHRHWKGSELAGRLGVTERTVRRDIDRLRSLGYPVDASAGVDGGYRPAVGAHIPPLLLDDDEAIALTVGLQRAAVSSIDGIEQTTVQLMAKLDQVMPDRLRRRVDAMRTSVEMMRWAPSQSSVPPASLTVLSQACRDSEEVRFEYRRPNGEESTRLVQPHQLVSAGRRWYLVAWDVRRDDWRTFRIDRMVDPKLAGSRFERRELPAEDASAFVAAGIRTMSATYRAVIIVDAPSDSVGEISHWFDATALALDDDRTQVELRAESTDWLASMISTVATRFEFDLVEAPDEVIATLELVARRLSRRDGSAAD